MLLTDFPEEVLAIIIGHVTRGALKHLRLTSKLFERLASPLIWDRIWISSHPLDLEVFERVTKSRFASNIRELVWDDTTFQRPLLNWKNFVYVNEYGHPSRRGAKYSPTRGAFDKWCEVVSGHHHIRDTRLDQKALNEAIPRLTNLKRVVLTNRNVEPIPREDAVPEFGSSPTVRQWKQWPERVPFPPSVCWYDDSHSVNEPIGQLFDLAYLDDGLPELGFRGALENARPFRGLMMLLRVFHEQMVRSGKPMIEEFIVRPSYEPGTEIEPGISYLFFFLPETPVARMVSLFEGLRVLNLVLSNAPHRSQGAWVVKKGHLARTLRAARQLEDLTLEMDYLPVLVQKGGALDPSHTYEHLKRVSFINGVFNFNPLLSFLQAHGSVLKDVHFYRCSIESIEPQEESRTWQDVLIELKHSKLCYKTCIVEDCMVSRSLLIYNNAGRSSDEFERFFTGDAQIPLDTNREEQGKERFVSYDKYY